VFIMPIDRRSRAVLAATLLLMGCQAAPPSLRPIKALRPEIETAAPRPGALRMMVRQEAITPAQAARFGLLDVQQLDWDTVRVWLSNSRDGFVTRRLRGTAVVDQNTNQRYSSLLFDDLTPGEGYQLILRLYRGGNVETFDNDPEGTATVQDESPQMIASGTSNVFAIRSGPNTANVTLTLSEGGRFNVDVDEPATTVNQTIAARFEVTTAGHYTVANLGPTHGDVDNAITGAISTNFEVGGIARETSLQDQDIFFTVPGMNRIFRWTGSAVEVVAGTDTVTLADYTNAGDYGDALEATLSDPRGIVRASTDDHIIFCDTNNSRIRILRPANRDPDNAEEPAVEANASYTYRIETLIGGGPTSVEVSDTATDALSLRLASPTAIVADDDGRLYFTDDLVASDLIRVYRYDGTGTGGDTELIAQIAREGGSRATGAHYGALAIDRRNNVLWVSTGGNIIEALRLNSGTFDVDATSTIHANQSASWTAELNGQHIKALAFDQTSSGTTATDNRWGTLFFSTETTASGTLVYRVPVATSGLVPQYRVPEPIAGGGITGLGQGRARGIVSMVLGWGSLLVDLAESADLTSTDTRLLGGRGNASWASGNSLFYEFNQVEGLTATTSLTPTPNPTPTP
jgi:hypothetical protein